jgi:hypothetical protein
MVAIKRAKNPGQNTIKTLRRMQTENLATTLIGNIASILPPDRELFRDAILEDGPLKATQSIRYLPYNQQVYRDGDETLRLSLVALLNNRRMEKFQLKGLKLRINRVMLKFSRNHLGIFVHRIRKDTRLIRILAMSSAEFSILGILGIDTIQKRRYFFNRHLRTIQPLLLATGILEANLPYLDAFAKEHKIEQVKRLGLPFYKTKKRAAASKRG